MSTDLRQRVQEQMAKFQKKEETKLRQEKDELKLEFITYEEQQRTTTSAMPQQQGKEEEELKLELVFDSPAPSLNAVTEQSAKLDQQRTQMETQGGSELLRGSSGLGAAQLAAIRKHEEQKATQGAEVLRASSGLGKAQLDAIRKRAEADQAGAKNRLTAEPVAANPSTSTMATKRVAVTAKTVASSMAMPSNKAAAAMAQFRKGKIQEPPSLFTALAAEEHVAPRPAKLETQEEELKLELITFENQGINGELPKDPQEDLKLELLYEPAPQQLSAVGEQVATLERQRAQMETNRGRDLELLRGCLGLSTGQLEVIRKHEEQKSTQSMEMLRGSSGLQKAQLDAIRKHANQANQVSPTQVLRAKVAAGKPESRL